MVGHIWNAASCIDLTLSQRGDTREQIKGKTLLSALLRADQRKAVRVRAFLSCDAQTVLRESPSRLRKEVVPVVP